MTGDKLCLLTAPPPPTLIALHATTSRRVLNGEVARTVGRCVESNDVRKRMPVGSDGRVPLLLQAPNAGTDNVRSKPGCWWYSGCCCCSSLAAREPANSPRPTASSVEAATPGGNASGLCAMRGGDCCPAESALCRDGTRKYAKSAAKLSKHVDRSLPTSSMCAIRASRSASRAPASWSICARAHSRAMSSERRSWSSRVSSRSCLASDMADANAARKCETDAKSPEPSRPSPNFWASAMSASSSAIRALWPTCSSRRRRSASTDSTRSSKLDCLSSQRLHDWASRSTMCWEFSRSPTREDRDLKSL
mmetsp:Transcript_23389/g.67683  ORF Transcript_23389/g.67683 Transcript_23389/m.67683 type:complete len:307 (+) Transcript_23389:175-1095(+)